MATRGAIGLVDGGGFRGRYNHWDSYPTHLGKVLWDAVTSFPTPAEGVEALRVFLTDVANKGGTSGIDAPDFLTNPASVSVYDDAGDDWLSAEDSGEWAYGFHLENGVSHGLSVFSNGRFVGVYLFEKGEPDWAAIEKGN